jgi:flagellar motility protein MotE (MotC chaperone)
MRALHRLRRPQSQPRPPRPRRRLRPRVLPLAILAMGGLLVLKTTHLVQAAGGAPAALASAGEAMLPRAQAAASHAAATEASAKEAPAKPAPAKEASRKDAPPAPPFAAPAAPPAEPPVNEAERALLLDLRARRTVLDAREQALANREATQAAAEQHLNERVAQLTALQTRLEQLDQTRRERDEANWRGLVKTYETMRPRDAAAILNDMDPPVLLQVLDRMKEAKAALVLAAMQPDRARTATAALAQSRSRSVAAPTLSPQG